MMALWVRMMAVAALALLAVSGHAEQARVELGLAYYAREEMNALSDNDILRLTVARAAPWGEAVGYAGVSLGVRNEDWTGDYPLHLQVEGGRYRETGSGRRGFGARATWADGDNASVEIGYGAERWFDRAALRGLAGLQATDDPALGDGSDRLGWFALAELSWYPADWLALRVSAMTQEDNPLGVVGFEIQPVRRVPVSLYLDWAVAAGDYRAFGDYDELVGGVRLVWGDGSLKERDRRRPSRLLYRPVDVY